VWGYVTWAFPDQSGMKKICTNPRGATLGVFVLPSTESWAWDNP